MEKGRELLQQSGLKITPVSDLTEAAQTVVAAAGAQ
jgi:succinyl-CoA synthetase beta subunit